MTVDDHKTRIDHLPAIWVAPPDPQPIRQTVIFLSGLSGTKASVTSQIIDLADAGFYSLI